MGEDGKGLFKWLSNIVSGASLFITCPFTDNWDFKEKFGFSFVTGVPVTPEATQTLTERIGFIRETQCLFPCIFLPMALSYSFVDGRFWELTSDLSKGDTAYTPVALNAHTDNTYFVLRLPSLSVHR